jgi:hypothetical protein
MFLFYLILFVLAKRSEAKNVTIDDIPKIEKMFPLPINDQLETIAAQFNQNPNWEQGNMPVTLTEEEETTPDDSDIDELKTGPGIIKQGHLFKPEHYHAYPIDSHGVHPESQHHIFLVRHGKKSA